MNILHITDFHYSADNALQIKVVNSIIRTLIEEKTKIDFIFFTGDLVQTGKKIETFNAANNALFTKLSENLNVQKENIIFCPGNHDINREAIHSAMKSFFEMELQTDDNLNNFYKKKTDSAYIDSIKPSENYRNFLSQFHKEGEENINRDLYSIHFRKFNNKTLGIASLNSAWFSSLNSEDKGNLLIPLNLLEEVKKELKSADKKIILIHHPLYFLSDFNFYGVESFIHNEFELLFSGHVHKVASISRHSGTNGIFEHVAKASLSLKENLGCSLIELDEIEENIIRVKELTYIEDSNNCHISQEIIHTVPCGAAKVEIISFRKKIFEKITIEQDFANNLLLLKDEEGKEDFLSLYNHPVLKKEPEGGLESKNLEIISLDDIVSCKENYLILGKDKCGKTSLLKRIQIECLINFSRNGKIPFFIDAKELENKLDANFDIKNLIRDYFSINRKKTDQILSSKDFLLLIDNYSPNSSMAVYLDKFLTNNSEISYVICTEYNISRRVDLFELGNTIYEKLYFHDLRRKEILTYTDKRLSINKKKEEIQEKIIQLCKQLELPLNYWTVSLLLLIHNKSSDSYSKNLFSVLDICIDEIFEKKQLALSNCRINFDQLKNICAELAKELFNNHKNTIYSAEYQDVLAQIEKTIISNDRISAKSKDVFEYFISCGILKQKNDTNFYVFRLNGFFEYFLALQMTTDISFKKEILDDDVKYLAFKNQFEIYSGLKRDDFDFLLTVFEKSKNKLNPIFEKYSKVKDNELLKKIQEPQHIEEVCRNISIKKALNSYEKAELNDIVDEMQINADVHEMKEMNPDQINSELIERYLLIFSRTFRNLDGISGNKEKMSEIFTYIIDSYCDFGFFIIDEFSDVIKQNLKNEDEEIDIENFPELSLLRFISNFSPLISQTLLFDGLGHYNLERMVKDEIEKLEDNLSSNQLKLYMLYFLLLDIDLNSNREYIQIAMEKIKIPILKYSIFIKLNYYLAFKSGNSKNLEQDLTNKIQKAKLNLDNKTNIGDIQKQIQMKKRISIINKNKL